MNIRVMNNNKKPFDNVDIIFDDFLNRDVKKDIEKYSKQYN